MAHDIPDVDTDIGDTVTREDGEYHVIQPVKGVEPETIQYTVDGVTYEFSDYQGKASRSHIYPETLVYGTCEVMSDG